MRKIKCIAIDDNKPALDLISMYAEKLNYIDLVKTYTDPIKAYNELSDLDPDLIFLDMQMPEMSGIDFLKVTKFSKLVIITSDYKDYAVDAIDLEKFQNLKLVTYLTKIITLENFIKACNKAKEMLVQPTDDFLYLKDNTSIFKVPIQDIIYIEPDAKEKPKLKIVLKGKNKITTRETIENLSEILKNKGFIRVSRSVIISLNHISEIKSKDQIFMTDGSDITISDSYQDDFFMLIRQNQIIGENKKT
jgi:two-component system LytT family response regulator